MTDSITFHGQKLIEKTLLKVNYLLDMYDGTFYTISQKG